VAAHKNIPDAQSYLESINASYAEYRAELVVFFRRNARDVRSVEDLVQSVYERMLRYRPRAPVEDPFAYLFQTARHVLFDANREARTEQDRYLPCDAAELNLRAEELSSLWIHEEGGQEIAAEEIDRVLKQLPRNCQIALVRQRRDGWTRLQIAQELGVSVNTVKDYIVKALEHFRAHFVTKFADR
jgi:RNA polymerase sigma factor (sigma-70 family)